MFNFNKKSEVVITPITASSKLTLADVMSAVSVAPPHPPVVYHYTEDAGQFPPSDLTRRAAIWQERNAAALAYEGDSVETITAELNAISDAIKVQNSTIGRLRAELIAATGGHAAVLAAAAAHIDLVFDPALVTGQNVATNEIGRLMTQQACVRGRLVMATAHETAKGELVATLNALLGGLK
ncbi:hypothetical protein AX768_27175 [Burkholderia sp. PAMC 28687]|uniref:hypothetical protein n=1 Tax=Burkholderia sp. PAMC 28687 TaxID=1795874 RepID=UPI000783534D|nr:hypothetical protein [Burkholderia sp. PAMC 28687]AMM17836.1 hypothetical protein AX768_27175 [Burkholderia sp. PAMC 28687]